MQGALHCAPPPAADDNRRKSCPRLGPPSAPPPLNAKTRFRVQVKHAVAIGPGKADVLQAIAETGSIAEAGRRLGMGYQRVWSLVRAMNGDFIEPLKLTQRGGAAGGGAGLTDSGTRILSVNRAIVRSSAMPNERWSSGFCSCSH